MPAPPRKGESKDKFISRAIAYLIREGKKPEQAAAIAHSMWRTKHGGKTVLTRKD